MATHPRPRLTTIAAIVTVGAAALLSGCGGTRYVVVQPTAQAAAAPTTSAPVADAATEEAVTATVEGALGLDQRPFAERTAHLTADASDLGDTYAAVLRLVADLDASIRVDGVTVAGDTATATVTVVVSGSDYASGVPVALVHDGGTWKVTRDGACAALAIGSPCPG